MVVVDQEKCIGCGSCERDCFGKVIHLSNGKAVVEKKCMECGHCVAVCPVNAVEIEGYPKEELISGSREKFGIDPEKFLNFLKFRRSTRQYLHKEVEQEKLEMILEAGRYSPTARNLQDVHFVVVQNEMQTVQEMIWKGFHIMAEKGDIPNYRKMLMNIWERHQHDPKDDSLFYHAPVLVILTCPTPRNGEFAARSMELMAESLGLGSLYSGFIQRSVLCCPEVQEYLGIAGETIAACLLIGYPDVAYKRTAPRKKANVTWK